MAYEYQLLPPIVLDTLPTFDDSTNFKFYFSVGNTLALNSADNDNIQTIQIAIQQQEETSKSNNFQSIYFDTQYQLFEASEAIIDTNSSFGDHYIQINQEFFPHYQKFYKIRIRFSKQPKTSLETNLQSLNFSEWSKICIVKKIEQVTFLLSSPFSDKHIINNEVKQISFIPYKITGFIKNKNTTNNEVLKSVNIVIRQSGQKKPVIISGNISPYNKVGFVYWLNKELKQSVCYIMNITFTTQSGYTSTKTYKFISISRGEDDNHAAVYLIPDSNRGLMNIQIVIPKLYGFNGNLVIRRTSAESNYTEWEDCKIIQFYSQGDKKNTVDIDLNCVYTWADKTVKSGMYYKYGVCKLKQGGWRGTFKKSTTVNACFFDDIYLMADNRQLRVKFDPTISNFKYNLNETLQTTLGSKYPFISRSGATNYRSFTLGGLITTYMDTEPDTTIFSDSLGQLSQTSTRFINDNENDFEKNSVFRNFQTYNSETQFNNEINGVNELKEFTSKKELYDFNNKFNFSDNEDPYKLMKEYNLKNDVNQYEDVNYEREFRQKVIEFLYSNSIKLFRSSTQGTMLVKLMNISLTPKQQLGRMLYSFSADAIEIDDYNLLNCNKYNIQTIGTWKEIVNTATIAGQLLNTFEGAGIYVNILNQIIHKYKTESQFQPYVPDTDEERRQMILASEDGKLKGMYKIQNEKINYLNIEIYSPPGLIKNKSYLSNEELKRTASKNIINGYLLILKYKDAKNLTPIVIKSNLQRKDSNFTEQINFVDKTNMRDDQFIYVGKYCIQNPQDLDMIWLEIPPNGSITFNIEYSIDVKVKQYDSIPIESNVTTQVGQIYKSFEPNKDIIKQIKDDYYFYVGNYIINESDYQTQAINSSQFQIYNKDVALNSYQNMSNYSINKENKIAISSVLTQIKEISDIYAMSFDADIGTIVSLKTSTYAEHDLDNEEYTDHVLNMGYLKLSDYNNSEHEYDSVFKHCKFKGLELSQTTHELPRINEYKVIDANVTYDTKEEIENPVQNGVYKIKNHTLTMSGDYNLKTIYTSQLQLSLNNNPSVNWWIYHNNNWYPFEIDGDNMGRVECPIDAIVNYVYQGGTTTYQLVQS